MSCDGATTQRRRPDVVIYGRLGCPSCHRALELLEIADVRSETVDVGHCTHCLEEMYTRLGIHDHLEGEEEEEEKEEIPPSSPDRGRRRRRRRAVAPLPQAWTEGGRYIGTLADLERWLSSSSLASAAREEGGTEEGRRTEVVIDVAVAASPWSP